MKTSIFMVVSLFMLTVSFPAHTQEESSEESTPAETAGKFTHESELSIITNGGNTQMETYNFATKNEYKKEKMAYQFGGHYTLGTTTEEFDSDEDGEIDDDEKEVTRETARNWDANAKVIRDMTKRVTGFFGVVYEGNEFAGIKQRDNYDLGSGYKIFDSEKTKSLFEVAYRYSLERQTIGDEDQDPDLDDDDTNEDEFIFQKARVYYDIERKFSETTTAKFWAEYIPNFTVPEDYQMNFEQSLSVKMTNTFSLKVAYKGMYDNLPVVGNQMMDYMFTTAIIAKF